MYWIGTYKPIIVTTITASDLLNYWGAIIGGFGTIVIGILAYHQQDIIQGQHMQKERIQSVIEVLSLIEKDDYDKITLSNLLYFDNSISEYIEMLKKLKKRHKSLLSNLDDFGSFLKENEPDDYEEFQELLFATEHPQATEKHWEKLYLFCDGRRYPSLATQFDEANEYIDYRKLSENASSTYTEYKSTKEQVLEKIRAQMKYE
jgi:hypothetical protein